MHVQKYTRIFGQARGDKNSRLYRYYNYTDSTDKVYK